MSTPLATSSRLNGLRKGDEHLTYAPVKYGIGIITLPLPVAIAIYIIIIIIIVIIIIIIITD